MNRTILNIVLAGILVALMGVHWLGARDYRQPNWEFLPNMVDSVPYDAYSKNPNFADGKTLQAPLPGTIPHGMPVLAYKATPEDALRAGQELANPFSNTNVAALARGAVMYQRFCLPCHGAGGAGDGPVAKRGFPPPPSLLADHARQMKDGQILHVITYGQGNMPSHAAQISLDDRWRAVLHVRQMQERAAATTTKAP